LFSHRSEADRLRLNEGPTSLSGDSPFFRHNFKDQFPAEGFFAAVVWFVAHVGAQTKMRTSAGHNTYGGSFFRPNLVAD
jgi:hypothetical protein